MSLSHTAAQLAIKYMGTIPEIGKQYLLADGRTVEVVSGSFFGDYGRVSNWWYWKEVLFDGTLSEKEECGYGLPLPLTPEELAEKGRLIAMINDAVKPLSGVVEGLGKVISKLQ